MTLHTFALAAGLALLPAMPPAPLPSNASGPTLTDLVAASGGTFDGNPYDYDCLLNAVLAANLGGALADPSLSVTLFAPDDRAFVRLARSLGYNGFAEAAAFDFLVDALTTLGGGDPIPVLTQVLLYHVATEELGLFQVILSKEIATLQGGVIRPAFLRLRDNEPNLKDPRLTFPLEIEASNGKLHTIDRVLIPIDLP
jgi:uncharacterized surface protein with fasciclin (FAS1) repeats